jgi:hypothetical protein
MQSTTGLIRFFHALVPASLAASSVINSRYQHIRNPTRILGNVSYRLLGRKKQGQRSLASFMYQYSAIAIAVFYLVKKNAHLFASKNDGMEKLTEHMLHSDRNFGL